MLKSSAPPVPLPPAPLPSPLLPPSIPEGPFTLVLLPLLLSAPPKLFGSDELAGGPAGGGIAESIDWEVDWGPEPDAGPLLSFLLIAS